MSDYEASYTESHPWLTFDLKLQRFPAHIWLLLGEAQSKSEHLVGTPLLPEVAARLHSVYLAKGALATTAIEGNTLTEEEVQRFIEGKLKLPPSKEYLAQEVGNIVEACNSIGGGILSGEPAELCVEDILRYNEMVLKSLPLGEDVTPGVIRTHSVGVGRYRGAPASECRSLLEKLCRWLSSENLTGPETHKIAFGILRAIIAHLYLAWIHPFGDGNGRTARLIEFQILLSVGVPSTAAHLLSNHYNLTRTEYYRQLDRAHRSGGDVHPFIVYALQGFIDGLKEQIDLIKRQQVIVHWINYVHDRFHGLEQQTDSRRKKLVLDLTDYFIDHGRGVPVSAVRHVSPRIAELYANKGDKTVKRDVDLLIDIGLIKRTEKELTPNFEIMLAFLPSRRTEPA